MSKNLEVKFQNPDVEKSYQIVSFTGEFDKVGHMEVTPEIDKLVQNFNLKTLIFDFSGLKFINSESIGYMIDIQGRLAKTSKSFVLVGADQHVKDVLNAVGIAEIIPMHETLESYLGK